MNPEQISSLVGEVEALVQQAGRAILPIYSDESRWQVETKADDSPLTQADLAAHRILDPGLSALGAGWPVLSEESESVPWPERRQWTTYWLVDPLDGTKEFVGRTGEFTVNVALIHDHRPVLGVVGVPLDGTLYTGVNLGSPVAWRLQEGKRAQIRVSPPASPIRLLASRRSGVDAVDDLLERLQSRGQSVEKVSAGSSLKLCRIAEGRADVYPRLAPTSEWDTAAAQAVLEAAGGRVTDLQGEPLRYNTKDSLLNPHFICTGGRPDLWSVWLDGLFTHP
ncbi:3'(2'),5'-bisphosphate nucleotidase CysQ [Hahella sp. SMD15-11]|uniref:3'(2'),5'-bisphosphate nucleotidase CysQ n=1 Tax=Thermohahella caldifontis TaxID=3142973 RepID=A0AB39UVE3_9GAMM